MLPIVIQITNINESYQNRSKSKIQGESEIIYLIHRIQKECNKKILLATTDQKIDDVYEDIAAECNTGIYRGNHRNVFDRLKGAMDFLEEDGLIRVYGNYPLLDIQKLFALEKEHTDGNYDYSYNEHSRGVMWGTGCEVFSRSIFDKLLEENLSISQKETIAFYLQQNTGRYRIHKYLNSKKRGEYKLNLETVKDLEVINEIVKCVPKLDNEHISDFLDSHEIIAHYNSENAAKEVGLDKMFLHLDKAEHLMSEELPDLSYPISVELTLTNRCNLNCIYCSDMDLRKTQGMAEQIEKKKLFALLKDLADGGTKGIVFEGGGEPTLYPDFNDAIMYAREQGLAAGLITNGTQRLDPSVLKQFEWIRVSLDASSAEEYAKLKGIDCFEKVLNNISHYCRFCDTVGVGYVVTNKNISCLESLVMRLRELGASYIQLRPVVDNPELTAEKLDLNHLKFYENSDFGVTVDGMKENMDSGNHGLPCVSHSITSVISGDGSVYMCGRLNIYDWIRPIGNINDSSFHDIWYGEERKKQAEMVSDGEFCQNNCPQCRVSKFNQLFHQIKNIHSKHFI